MRKEFVKFRLLCINSFLQYSCCCFLLLPPPPPPPGITATGRVSTLETYLKRSNAGAADKRHIGSSVFVYIADKELDIAVYCLGSTTVDLLKANIYIYILSRGFFSKRLWASGPHLDFFSSLFFVLCMLGRLRITISYRSLNFC